MLLTEEGALALLGNHDAMALTPSCRNENRKATFTAAWTHPTVGRTAPVAVQLAADAAAGSDPVCSCQRRQPRALALCTTHVQPRPAWMQQRRSGLACITFLAGHVHLQTLYYRGVGDGLMPFMPQSGVPGARAAPPPVGGHGGSVGQPRDGDSRAMYALFDDQRAQLTFHRVRYDYLAAAQAIRRDGFARIFADRLEAGR